VKASVQYNIMCCKLFSNVSCLISLSSFSAIVTLCMLISSTFCTFPEHTHTIYGEYTSEICVTCDGYLRLRFICIRACGDLDAYARTNKSQLQPQSLSQISFSCLWLPVKRLLNAIHCWKAGVTCRWWKKGRKLSKKIYAGKTRKGFEK